MSAGPQSVTKLQPGLDRAGVGLYGRREVLDRRSIASVGSHDDADGIVGLGQVWVQLQGRLELLQGAARIALKIERRSEIEPREGIVGRQFGRLTQMSHGLRPLQ